MTVLMKINALAPNWANLKKSGLNPCSLTASAESARNLSCNQCSVPSRSILRFARKWIGCVTASMVIDHVSLRPKKKPPLEDGLIH